MRVFLLSGVEETEFPASNRVDIQNLSRRQDYSRLSTQPLSCRRDIVSPSPCRIDSAAMTARRRGLAAISEKSLGTWEHGNIFSSRFLNFPDFQLIFLFQKWRKFAFSKAPPFDFSAKISDFLMPSRGCWRMPIMPIRNSQN